MTAGLKTLESRGGRERGNRQEEGDIRGKTEKVEVKLCGEKFAEERTRKAP